jgi:uncharacterized membrane protein YheB (UPF0754 family)
MELVMKIVIGAFIGYITNCLAIKMIFRPYRQYSVFGYRIPFTPGLIYARRSEIAKNIGVVVEQDLLHKEKIKGITGSKIKHYLASKGIGDESLLVFFSTISNSLLEKFLRSINISQIVNDEIMALDMKKLEKIVLNVSKKEFVYIQYVGAVIGGLIGISQGLVNLY